MAKKRKIPKLTPEDHARFAETTRRIRERIEHHRRLAELEDSRGRTQS